MTTKLSLRTALAMATLLAPLATAGVNEIIAQFPANDAATANQLFDALLDEGEVALADLCDQIGPLGSNDGAARYALTGLARYVSRPDAGSARKDLEEVFLEALEGADNAEVKHFLLRQLQQCGGQKTVSEIDVLVLDDVTASHAILALDAIGTRKAQRALTKALKKTSGASQMAILSALADDGGNHNAARTAEKRLASGSDTNECIHLLSILVDLRGDKAHPNLISAMDREEPRCRKAALVHAASMMDKYAAKKWRKKLSDEDTPDEAKREIGRLLAEYDAGM